MRSVPGAVATGSRFTGRSSLVSQYPVATAPGTDLVTALGRKLRQYLDFSLMLFASTIPSIPEEFGAQVMSDNEQTDLAPDKGAPVIPHSDPAGGTGSLEAAMMLGRNPIRRFLKVLGPGLVTV